MRAIRQLATMLATLGLSATAIAQSTAPHATTHDPDLIERAEVASSAYNAIKRYFAHAEALPTGYDFEARYRAYLREALAAPDRRGFSLATMRLFASLGNGHTDFTDYKLWDQTPDLPFRARRVEGRWTVTISRIPALAPGDMIEMVDGKPVDIWLAPVRAAISASSLAALDRLSWTRPFLLPQRFTLGLAGGRTVAVDRLAPVDGTARGRGAPKSVEITRRPDGVVVIRIPSFDNTRFEDDAVAAVRSAANASVILFDLRGNGGGSTPNKLLAAVMIKPYRGTLVATPMTIAENDADATYTGALSQLPTVMMRYGPDTTAPAADAARGRMAVIADGGCASSCEDFVLRFKDAARGPVFGESTFGSTGQPYFVSYPDLGISFRVSTKRESFPDGRRFEGVGVAPDVPVPLTRTEVQRGTDDQLERAVRLLLKQDG